MAKQPTKSNLKSDEFTKIFDDYRARIDEITKKTSDGSEQNKAKAQEIVEDEINKTKEAITKGGADSDIFIDARPDKDFRVFAKGNLEYALSAESSTEAEEIFQLKELFSDFTIKDTLFVRAGKQTATWGVGYFYSPADIINLEPINPEDPEADREGPVAVKLHLPIGIHNIYLYTIVDDIELNSLSFAPKIEFVVGNTEIGIGGYYKINGPLAGMATLTTSIGDINIFGEAMLLTASEKTFVEEDSGAPMGVSAVSRADEVFFSGTVGITYSFDDEYDNFDLSLSSQYYYNGQGYADQDFIINNMAGFLYLISQGELTAADILQRGQHYTAASVSWREMFGTDFTFSTFWMGNMVDLSGMVDCSLKYALDDYLSISVGLKQTYGDEGAEFTPSGALTALYIKTSLGTGKF